MSATATTQTLAKGIRFYEATIGKKMVMAVTGCIMFSFVIGHLIGNLQIYLPPGEDGVYPIDNYAVMLRSLGAGLWVIRGALLLTVVLHIIAATQLWLGEDEVLVKAKHLTHKPGVRRLGECDEVTYIHLLFDHHDLTKVGQRFRKALLPKGILEG